MRYYLIVGEASGDLHASCLMHSLKREDSEAEFRFFGGDLMSKEGGTRVKHYKELAYMGFVPVLLHLRTIFKNMALCKRDIVEWQPDVVILVDYPGFNLDIAEFVHTHTRIPTYYYISPKIWAWKEWRIKSIKRYVDEMFSILPFEVPFYEQKHHYKIHYVGNPTAEEVRAFRVGYHETKEQFCLRNGLDPAKPIVALLAGSRKQEIKDNLPGMLSSLTAPIPTPAPSQGGGESPSLPFASLVSACGDEGGSQALCVSPLAAKGVQVVIAGAPSIPPAYYKKVLAGFVSPISVGEGPGVKLLFSQTYELYSHADAALVTSGTATLEAALFRVPQAVCYETPVPKLIRWGFNHVIKCKYISLVNLIADREVVPELLADRFTVANMRTWLCRILPGGNAREEMLRGYDEVAQRLGNESAPDNAAYIMVSLLRGK